MRAVGSRQALAARQPGRPLAPAPLRHHRRRLEAVAGEQHGVGAERVQLREVRRAALGQVGVRLARRSRPGRWRAPSARRPGSAHRRARSPGRRARGRCRSRPARTAGSRAAGRSPGRRRRAARGSSVDRRAGPGWRAASRRRTPGAEQIGVGRGQQGETRHQEPPEGFSPLVVGRPVVSVWLSSAASGRASQWRNRPGLVAPGSCPTGREAVSLPRLFGPLLGEQGVRRARPPSPGPGAASPSRCSASRRMPTRSISRHDGSLSAKQSAVTRCSPRSSNPIRSSSAAASVA